jgi:hypothetical protein
VEEKEEEKDEEEKDYFVLGSLNGCGPRLGSLKTAMIQFPVWTGLFLLTLCPHWDISVKKEAGT